MYLYAFRLAFLLNFWQQQTQLESLIERISSEDPSQQELYLLSDEQTI